MADIKYFNSEEVKSITDDIITKRAEFRDFIDRQKQNVKDLHEYWSGTTGDEVFEQLEKYSKDHDNNRLTEFDNRIKFLNEVIGLYAAMEQGTTKNIDENTSVTA